jgi:hypothetical protein
MNDLFPGEGSVSFNDAQVGMEEHAELYRKLTHILNKSRRKERVLLAVVNELFKEVKLRR